MHILYQTNTIIVEVFAKEVFCMATSSITKNFVISRKEQIEAFADAVEASANNIIPLSPVSAKQIRGTEELKKMMKRRKKF